MKKPVLAILMVLATGFIGGGIGLVLVLLPAIISRGVSFGHLNPTAAFLLISMSIAGILIGKGLGIWLLIRQPHDPHVMVNQRICIACGYDLFANCTGTCPECGSTIPPRQVAFLRRHEATASDRV